MELINYRKTSDENIINSFNDLLILCDYCEENNQCRRNYLTNYFDDKYSDERLCEKNSITACDNCQDHVSLQNGDIFLLYIHLIFNFPAII